MEHNSKSKLLGLSALALVGGTLPSVTSCNNTSVNHFFTVKNESGLEIEFCDVGASIYSIKHGDTYLTYHPTNTKTFMDKAATPYYYGKTLGRVAGRLQDGKFSLDGTEYKVQVNEKGDTKNNCLHGGKDALSFKTFKRYISVDNVNKCTNIAFNYFSPANEAGFPEAIDVWVVYTLYNNSNKLETNLYAIPTGKTVINLSTHSLFRLGNSGDVLDYQLTIPTDTRAQYNNEDTKKTGQVVIGTVSTKDTVFDFNNGGNGKKIGTDMEAIKEYDPISGGIDHIWVFNNTFEEGNRYVNLYNPENKINFKVTATTSSVNGFIIYSNDYPRSGQIMQGDNKEDTKYAGITVEPYTYFTKDNIDPITYTPDKPFHNGFTYEWTFNN